MTKKILLIEDEAQVVSFIIRGLTEEGFEVSAAVDGHMGLDIFLNNNFDLIILDIMIPGINGIQICKEIRKVNTQVPILFLSALGTSENIVQGLESGADDYLVKPFKFIELLARIKSLLRRTDIKDKTQTFDEIEEIRFGELRLNDYTKTVYRKDEQINLTATEYRLLYYFLKNKERVLSRVDILDEVWGVNFDLGTNVVDVYVNYLRNKIDKNYTNKYIHTVVGMGYVLKQMSN
jgi:two-component system, OmpR family, copper resistance phosphate regulon response regulator CusR